MTSSPLTNDLLHPALKPRARGFAFFTLPLLYHADIHLLAILWHDVTDIPLL